jgi:hypothetical protein
MVGVLNAMAKADAAREAPGLLAINAIRDMQKSGYRSATEHNRTFAKMAANGAFDRLHPDSDLRRTNVPRDPTFRGGRDPAVCAGKDAHRARR